MKTTEQIGIANKIAAKHGCEISTGAFRQRVLRVLPQYQQGHPQDGSRIATVRRALETAGISTAGLKS